MSSKKENYKVKMRNWYAVSAQFENSAGAMKVKKAKENRQCCRDFRKNWRQYAEEAEVENDIDGLRESGDTPFSDIYELDDDE